MNAAPDDTEFKDDDDDEEEEEDETCARERIIIIEIKRVQSNLNERVNCEDIYNETESKKCHSKRRRAALTLWRSSFRLKSSQRFANSTARSCCYCFRCSAARD